MQTEKKTTMLRSKNERGRAKKRVRSRLGLVVMITCNPLHFKECFNSNHKSVLCCFSFFCENTKLKITSTRTVTRQENETLHFFSLCFRFFSFLLFFSFILKRNKKKTFSSCIFFGYFIFTKFREHC